MLIVAKEPESYEKALRDIDNKMDGGHARWDEIHAFEKQIWFGIIAKNSQSSYNSSKAGCEGD